MLASARYGLGCTSSDEPGKGTGVGPGDAGSDSGPDQDAGTLPPSGKDVVVLGAGVAGLAAAYELRSLGYNVVAVLEAQTRVGGRVLTLRDGFANGQYGEAGATRIPSDHNFTLGYAKQFGLELREFIGSTSTYYVRGKKFQHTDGDPWPADVFPGLAAAFNTPASGDAGAGGKGPDSIVLDFEALDRFGTQKDVLDPSWPTGDILRYDAMGIEDYIRAVIANASDAGTSLADDVILLDRVINGMELPTDGALYWLMADVADAAWDQTYAIKGGNDQLPSAFAKALGPLVQLDSKVTAIAQDGKTVTVTYTKGGQAKTITADYCVCSLPFTIVRRLDLSAARFTADKMELIDNLSYQPVGRCFLQTNTRFWQKAPYGNKGLKVARTDTFVERQWESTAVQDGDNGILLAYLQAANGVLFGQQPEAARMDYVKNGIAAYWPEITTEFKQGVSKAWQEDPFVGGAWAFYKPGEMGKWFPLAKLRQGHVHFCGEHTSVWSGWMQGSFESAGRVIREIAGKGVAPDAGT